jgi:cell division protein FtsW (lipid II flippase)
MSIGTGIVLLLFGLILMLGVVDVDLPWVDDYRLGVLLTILGVVALVLVMTIGTARRGTTHVIERDRGVL